MNGEAKPGLLVLLGIGCLAGAAAVAWFSSVQTLQLTRTNGSVTVSLQARLFALVPIGERHLENVQSARTVTTIPQVSRARPFTRLFFDTPSGPVDLWTTQHLFVRKSSEIEAFFADPTQREATFSSLVDGSETRRFVFAQLAMLFLVFCGFGLIYMAVRALLGTNRDIGPVDAAG